MSPHAEAELAARIAAQRARIARLEQRLWDEMPSTAVLEFYQAAYRELEALIDRQEHDLRHHFVIAIPVADNPRQLESCLDSLLTLCRVFGYGGMRDGRFARVSVLLADDSADPVASAQIRELAGAFTAQGLATQWFGSGEQRALLQRLAGIDLGGVVGTHSAAAFGHKGQGMMRNIAYLRLAQWRAELPDERLLFYTIDADQVFEVEVPTPDGPRALCALNHLAEIDRLFGRQAIDVLSGKVVGDPPVSPAVMAGNFLDDVIALLRALAAAAPDAPYRQPGAAGAGSDAAYHDMAELFGLQSGGDSHAYRCGLPGEPGNAACLDEFSRRLNGFFHGRHPTRSTWYRHQAVADSVQPARTVYTGNYVFSPAALGWFIPFAPLRLRMSGPTMGRLLRAALGGRFVSANLPMLHRRTLATTGASEFRPGVVVDRHAVDLGDEFERQFYGDVMLFAVERLTGQGLPAQQPAEAAIAAALEAVCGEMTEKYLARARRTAARLAELERLLHDPAQWWNRDPRHAAAVGRCAAFAENLAHNFTGDAPGLARIADAQRRADWLARQRAAIATLPGQRRAWRQALRRLDGSGAP
jgi:hypothetical protein